MNSPPSKFGRKLFYLYISDWKLNLQFQIGPILTHSRPRINFSIFIYLLANPNGKSRETFLGSWRRPVLLRLNACWASVELFLAAGPLIQS